MTDVMKKVWEEAAAAQETEAAADGPASAPNSGHAAESNFIIPDSPQSDGEQELFDDPLAAALEPAAKEPAASFCVPTDTVEWDAKRVDPSIVAFHDRSSAICEQYRSIRARLLTMNRTNAPQVIVVTSSVPQEGKSVSTLNLAILMAGGGEQNILVADADLRRSSVARMLGIHNRATKGLADLFAGEATVDEVLLPTPFSNLKVIPAGNTQAKNYAELLGSSTARNVLDELRRGFDYTFVDTPPVTTVSDVSMLAPHCDGVIMVIEMRRTPEPTVQAAIRTLQTNNVKILGCVLARYREERSGYYDRYYRYYRND